MVTKINKNGKYFRNKLLKKLFEQKRRTEDIQILKNYNVKLKKNKNNQSKQIQQIFGKGL